MSLKIVPMGKLKSQRAQSVLLYFSVPTTDPKLKNMYFAENLQTGVIEGADHEYHAHFPW